MVKKKATPAPKASAAHARASKEPVLTSAAFQISIAVIALGFVAQLVIAVLVFPTLPKMIPSSWMGSTSPYGLVPRCFVFFVFPGAQIILAVLAAFSPRDERGRRIMESGKAATLVALALLFSALQASIFSVH
jgi:uncharacterized membrane protein